MWWVVLAALGASSDMARVEGGVYRPLFPVDPEKPETAVATFRLDVRPVTRGEFAAFVASNPAWQRGRVAALFADRGYLAAWTTPLVPDGRPTQPVVGVSWFAARAYCRAQGRRLPTTDEWEYAARASATQADATGDPAFNAKLLEWYGRPTPADLPDAGLGEPDVWGVRDLHGLVWEWVEDFDSVLVTSDPREGGDDERYQFCGTGALSATETEDYARFMRFAFRTSLEGRYTTANLGFRCAADEEAP